MSAVWALIRRDVRIAMRRRSEVLTAPFFFVMVVSLFPLGVGPDPKVLHLLAPGILWVGALLATLLNLHRLFGPDFEDGTLEQDALSPTPLVALVGAKIVVHWLLTGLPLVLLAPVMGIQYDLDGGSLLVLMASLMLGTPVLSLIGAIGAALTLGVRGGGVLLSLLVLPLYIPALIFGAGAVDAYASGLGAQGHLSLLAALLVLALFFAPWAIASALRLALE